MIIMGKSVKFCRNCPFSKFQVKRSSLSQKNHQLHKNQQETRNKKEVLPTIPPDPPSPQPTHDRPTNPSLAGIVPPAHYEEPGRMKPPWVVSRCFLLEINEIPVVDLSFKRRKWDAKNKGDTVPQVFTHKKKLIPGKFGSLYFETQSFEHGVHWFHRKFA